MIRQESFLDSGSLWNFHYHCV